jgi:hypothetical protein
METVWPNTRTTLHTVSGAHGMLLGCSYNVASCMRHLSTAPLHKVSQALRVSATAKYTNVALSPILARSCQCFAKDKALA